jgi:hypothetical protein
MVGGKKMGRGVSSAVLCVFLFGGVLSPCSAFSQPVESTIITPDASPVARQRAISEGATSNSSAIPSQRINYGPGQFPSAGRSAFDGLVKSREIVRSTLFLRDPQTRIAPSHLGHPGYENVAFLYDKAVDAMVFKTAGYQREAAAVLDYFAERLSIPLNEIRKNADVNGIYGILKLYPSSEDPRTVGLVNAFNCRSMEREGRGRVEYWTTPGPLAFLILAFLSVDQKKYLPEAIKIGQVLLAMQRDDGAITDGDREPDGINTEPHMDSFAAFLALHEATGDPLWKTAAERAWEWFTNNVFMPEAGAIYQGVHKGLPGEIFATDAYSWTMAGPAGDRMPLEVLERLTDRMLRQGLSRITIELPDGLTRTVTLVDFADVKDVRVTADRNGYHPMGSIEWIGGVILALQKNAVRFWETGDSAARDKARFYKALAEYFMAEALRSFYKVDGMDGKLSFYATGQWVPTGHGWRTPYFYVKDPQGNPVVKGGSTIGAWPVLPLNRRNPFILNDNFGVIYDAIPINDEAALQVDAYVTSLVRERDYTEAVPMEMAEGVGDVTEMWQFNQKMFRSFLIGDYYSVILWAEKITGNAEWIRKAKDEQLHKSREIGGLVDYPWGTSPAKAKSEERSIMRYPLLNEVGAAMWGLAVAHFKLGNTAEAKAWIRTIIETVPYHQIFAPDGPGYWNALVSWETNPGGTFLDAEMGELYREVLSEMGRTSALPKAVLLNK